MKNILLQVRELYGSMSGTQKIIADYIREDSSQAASMTIRELAEKSYTSPSSVIRFCKMLGFEGFKDFQANLQIELATLKQEDKINTLTINQGDDLPTLADKITSQNIQSLEESLYLLDADSLNCCVDLLLQAQRILLFGIGASQFVAQDFYLKLFRLNYAVTLNVDADTQLVGASNSQPEDAAVLFSYSGKTQEILEYARVLKKNRTPVIAITRYSQSPLVKLADHILFVSSAEALFRSAAMSSRIAQLNTVDILYTAMMLRKYDKSVKTLTDTYIQKE